MNKDQKDDYINTLIAKAEGLDIPRYMHEGMINWVLRGIQPGHFLSAVISNDLRSAVGEADDTNIGLIPNYIQWFYNYAPFYCWGSPAALESWKGRELKLVTNRHEE